MNTLERIQAFEELIQYSEREQQFLGTGNPLAPILIIGKESADNAKDEEAIDKHICNNVKAVKDCFYNCDLAISICRYIPNFLLKDYESDNAVSRLLQSHDIVKLQ